MKRLKWISLSLLALLILLILIVNYGMGAIVKTAVEEAGPSLAGVQIKLEKTHFRLLQGIIQLSGFELGNPEGFKTPCAIRVGEIDVNIDMKSLLSDTIVIRRIYVKAPEITYELGLGKSNIGRILERLEGPDAGKKPDPGAKKAEKKVIIEDFRVEEGRVKISATLALGHAAPIPLPAIHLTNIGKEDGQKGASPIAVIKKVFVAIGKGVGQGVSGSLKLIGIGSKEEKPELANP